jgi:hypothetical protein
LSWKEEDLAIVPKATSTSLLLDIDSNAAKIRAPLLLRRIHILHCSSISNEMQSLLLSLSPSLPNRTALESISVRVIASDETRPVSLSHRHNSCISGRVTSRSIAMCVLGTPDSGHFDSVGDAAAGCCGDGVNDVPVVVVDVLAVEGCGVDVREVDAGAVVSELAVLVRGLSPPSSRVGELVGCIVRVECVDFADLVKSQEGELVFEESVAFTLGRSVDGNEHGAFVCVVAVDGGEFDEVALAECGHGEIGDHISVESGSIHVQWRVLSAREGSVDVLGLEISGVETAETCQGIVGACAAGANDQVVVHELGVVDTADSSEGL